MTSFSSVGGRTRDVRRYSILSTITVTATIDATSKNQMGQPAAWMSENKCQLRVQEKQRATVSASLSAGKASNQSVGTLIFIT
jgi:hypothetical protein